MTKAAANKKKPKKSPPKKSEPAGLKVNRRREWRFELPLSAIIEGKLPGGDKFQENTEIQNISSSGVYFCLDSGVVIGSKLNLVIELPEKLSKGKKKLKLCIGGLTVRLEEVDKEDKKHGVALRFEKQYKIIPED